MYGTENEVMSIKTQTDLIMKKMMAAAIMAAVVFSFSAANAQRGNTGKAAQTKAEVKKSPAQTKMETARAERIGKPVDKKKAADNNQKNDAKKLEVKKK